MSLGDFFRDLLGHEANHLVLARIPSARQDKPINEIDIVAEKHYIRVWLAEMFLRNDRRLFREFTPVVHSTVRLKFADKPAQELPYVAGPQDLKLDADSLDHGVQTNHALTNLLPFRGGTVSIAAGLFAYKTKDLLANLSQVLHKITELLNVGQLSTALNVVDSAVGGIQSLVGSKDKEVRLLYYEGFGGETVEGGATLRSGHIAIINADAATFAQDKLFVKNSGLCFGNSLATALPLTGADYMLLRIEASDTRDDFLGFESFSSALDNAIKEGARDRASGDAIIQAAIVNAWSSPDLTFTDCVRIGKAMKDLYKQAMDSMKIPADRVPWSKVLNDQIKKIDAGALARQADSPMGNKGFEEYMRLISG